MNNYKKSVYNIIFSLLGQIITIAIGLLLPRIYMVSYGSEVNGLLNSVNQCIIYLSLFEAGVGTVTLQALYKPISLNDKDGINGILAATHRYYKKTGMWYLISLIFIASIYPVIIKSDIDYWTIVGVTFLSGFFNVVSYCFHGKYKLLLQAEGKNYLTTNLTTITFVLTSFLKILLIYLGYGILMVQSVALVINLMQTVYITCYIKKKYKWIDLSVCPNNYAISQKNYTLIHQIAGMIFQNTDILILSMVCGLKVVSVYSIYKMIITNIENVLSILVNSVSFSFGQTFQTDLLKFKVRIDTFESIYSSICFAFFAVTLYLFVPFLKLYTNGVNDIEYADYKLALLFVSIALLLVVRTPMQQTINYAGHFKETLAQTIIETILNLSVSMVAVFYFGIYGVLIGTVFALLYRSNDIIIYANKKILGRSPKKTYLIHGTNVIILGILQWVFRLIIRCPINSYFDFILVGAMALSISMIVFMAVQCTIFPRNIKIIGEIIKRK